MSQTGGKDKMENVFKHSKMEQKSCCSVNSLTAESKCCKPHNNTHGQYKMKQLKSHKERNQMRGGGREASKTKSHHHHQSIKNIAPFHNCCHSKCFCTSKREASFSNIIPAAKEPSIITDNRLIGHHGLFNHEVKSVDIERLLSEQRKLDKQVPEKNCVSSHLSLKSHSPSPFSCEALGGDNNGVAHCVDKSEPATNAQDCSEKEKKLGQGSDGLDVTPGQRPRQDLDSPSGSYKSIFSSKHSSLDGVVFKGKKTNSVMTERGKESQLSPTSDREIRKTLNKKLKTHKISSPKQTPKHQNPPIQQTQSLAHNSPSPLQLSSSAITQSFDEQTKEDLSCLSGSVSDIAARLSDCLNFPFLRKGDLVKESREELLRVLWERHGTQLQENLLKVERSLSFGANLPNAISEDDVLFPVDTSTSKLCFDIHRTHSETAERLTDLMHTSTSLDDIFRHSFSPTFYTDSKPPGASASDHLFSHSTNSCWAEKSSASHLWGESSNRSNRSFMFDSFENSLLNHGRSVSESCGNNIQPFLTYPVHLPDQHSAEPVHFPMDPDPFRSDRSNDHPFSDHIRHPHQSNNFQTFSQFTHPSSWPTLRPNITDMMRYPPSHILEREPVPPFSSLLSPEHWSFPPMRLY